jgi:hypothetical protein
MISRKTAFAITDAYYAMFTKIHVVMHGYQQRAETRVLYNEFYEFLFLEEYEAWFCNLIKQTTYPRELKDFLLRIHTGESFYSVTKEWSQEQRKKLGQEYLRYLAESYLKYYDETGESRFRQSNQDYYLKILRNIELDGYKYENHGIQELEIEVYNVEQEYGILESLYRKLELRDVDEVFEYLKLSQLHYVEERWSDCISNSRKFFEKVFYEVGRKYSEKKGLVLSEKFFERPVEIRDFLESSKLLEKKEREAVDKIYGLLSHTGGHPYMAESDQAKLLRQISLSFSQFILLRLEGALK